MKEMMMSRCFTWFPIGGYRRTQYITSIGLFYKEVGILLGWCLTGRISGSYSQEMMGLVLEGVIVLFYFSIHPFSYDVSIFIV